MAYTHSRRTQSAQPTSGSIILPSWTVVGMGLMKSSAEPPTPHAEQAAVKAGARRMLVVDDNVDAAESLAMILKMNGHETRCAHDPETALTSAADFRPDVILLDIGLPRLDGYEVAKRIRAKSWPVRLIALSGYGRTEDTERAKAAGFDAYLVKPVDFDELERVLERLR
jgi:CheY-like chemotaxis protein